MPRLRWTRQSQQASVDCGGSAGVGGHEYGAVPMPRLPRNGGFMAMTPTEQEAWAKEQGDELSRESHCRYCDRWQSAPHPAAKCLSDVEGMAKEITAALLSALAKGKAEQGNWSTKLCSRHHEADPLCGVCNPVIAEQARVLAQARDDVAQVTTQLEAWQSVFQTSQLSHAAARLEAAENERDRLRADLANLNVLLPCGHRKVDMDDSYGKCVFCQFRDGYHEFERELTEVRKDTETWRTLSIGWTAVARAKDREITNLCSRKRGYEEYEVELVQLRALVKEWLCETCHTVYPGPPQPGFACVICPKCGGDTGPRERMAYRKELAKARADLERAKGLIRELRDASGHTIQCWQTANWTACIPECGAVEKMKTVCLEANRFLRAGLAAEGKEPT